MWNRNVFLQSRIAAFQVYDKMDNFNQKVCHVKFCEHKNKNFQNNGKIKIIAYLWFWSYVLKKFLMKNFLFCVVAGSFASFTYLNSILRLKNTFNFQLTIKKLFFYSPHDLSILNIANLLWWIYPNLNMAKLLSFWILGTKLLYMVHAWNARIRYARFCACNVLFSVPIFEWLSIFVLIITIAKIKLISATENCLPNIFSVIKFFFTNQIIPFLSHLSVVKLKRYKYNINKYFLQHIE